MARELTLEDLVKEWVKASYYIRFAGRQTKALAIRTTHNICDIEEELRRRVTNHSCIYKAGESLGCTMSRPGQPRVKPPKKNKHKSGKGLAYKNAPKGFFGK